jgi:CRISPR-associated protein (TIGR02584 family)
VTESLYALAARPQPPFVPTEVHLITTREGAERARLALLSADPGWFHRLLKDYALPGVAFDAKHIHVLEDATGAALEDIRTPADNERAADFITEMVRHFTADAKTALHVSIAGGRKTMGFYLGYALSLFGRQQDRLSHVLVAEPFESSWDFFYPTPYSRVITTRDNKLADTAQAEVTLAEIPFVSLRHGLPQHLLEGEASFSDTVAAARRSLAPPELVLDLKSKRVCAAGKVISLPPAQVALLSVFARMAQRGAEPLAAPPKEAPDPDWAKRFLAERRKIGDDLADLDATERALKHGMDGDYFSTHLSKLRKLLRRELGPAAAPYLVKDGGVRPRRYRLTLSPQTVRFGSVESAGVGHVERSQGNLRRT